MSTEKSTSISKGISLTDVAETATETVAEVAEEVADISRGISGRNLGWGFGGLIVGLGLGAVGGYIFCKRKLEPEYEQKAAEEVAEMREEYHRKAVALDGHRGKGELEDLVRERGYSSPEPESTRPPMAVTPPAAVVEAAEEEEDEAAPEVEVEVDTGGVIHKNAFKEFGDENRPKDEWDWHKERANRSPVRPYVIHEDEREEMHAYQGVTYTYFEDDDVLVNEREEILDKEDREKIIGEANLEKFGHGTDDDDTVYVRNDRLEMVIEICRSPNSYAEEVHGFEPEIRHSDHRRHRDRAAFDDE